MGDVEDAIAKALKKEGITPKPVKITARPAEKETKPEPEKKEMKEPKEPKGETSGGGKSGKRRKHKSDKESSRKKAKLAAEEEAETHAPEHKYESEDMDEYEMMNVRGGSPSQHGSQRNVMYYGSGKPCLCVWPDFLATIHAMRWPCFSDKLYFVVGVTDSSYSSYESFDSNDHRRKHRSKKRNERNSRRSHRSGNSKREKRRRDDSDDEGIGNYTQPFP